MPLLIRPETEMKPLKQSLRHWFSLGTLIFFITTAPVATGWAGEGSPSPPLKLELFVMSKCPYGIYAEQVLGDILDRFRDNVDLTLYYVAEETEGKPAAEQRKPPLDSADYVIQDQLFEAFLKTKPREDFCKAEQTKTFGHFRSLHGRAEIEENIRQVIMAQVYEDRYFDYILCRAEAWESESWEECARSVGIDPALVDLGMLIGDGEEMLRENIRRTRELEIDTSPTLFVNGELYSGVMDTEELSRFLCRKFEPAAGPVRLEFTSPPCRDVPICGSDDDCIKAGKIGLCESLKEKKAACIYSEPTPCSLTILTPPEGTPTRLERGVRAIRIIFPAVEIQKISSLSHEGKRLIQDYGIEFLPAYLFDDRVGGTARFSRLEKAFIPVRDRYLFNPILTGGIYWLDRSKIPRRLDLFLMSLSPLSMAAERLFFKNWILDSVDLRIHYLVQHVGAEENKDVPGRDFPEDLSFLGRITRFLQSSFSEIEKLTRKPARDPRWPAIDHYKWFKSPFGRQDVIEDIRRLCAAHYYPDRYIQFIRCRNYDLKEYLGKTDWKDCAFETGLNADILESCAEGPEGERLLAENIKTVNHLDIHLGPSFLFENQILIRGVAPNAALAYLEELLRGTLEE